MKKHEFQAIVDQRLSGLSWQQVQRSAVLQRMEAEEEKQVKKVSVGVLLVAALICLSLATAVAGGLFFTRRMSAAITADEALARNYGVTAEMLAYFHRDVQEQPGDRFVVTYRGVRAYETVLGKYTVVLENGGAQVSWSHDGKDTSGGFDAEAWGCGQLKEMIRIHKETHSEKEYAQKAAAIAQKNSAPTAAVATPPPQTAQAWEEEQAALAAQSALSAREMETVAREAVQMVYELTDEQTAMMEYVPEMSYFVMPQGGGLHYCVNLQLQQKKSENPAVFPEYTEKDGVYAVTVNAETGAIEDILYESPMIGNG